MGRGFRLWIMVLSKIYPHDVDEFTGCLSAFNFGRGKPKNTSKVQFVYFINIKRQKISLSFY